jgi:hypothetical protein
MKIRIEGIPQNISIKNIEIDLNLDVNNGMHVNTVSVNENKIESLKTSESSDVNTLQNEIQNIELKASDKVPPEMMETL